MTNLGILLGRPRQQQQADHNPLQYEKETEDNNGERKNPPRYRTGNRMSSLL
jgi:hypothetical protein